MTKKHLLILILIFCAALILHKTPSQYEQYRLYKKAALQYGELPGWLILSWEKCKDIEQVPENFRKECVCYEIQRQK